MTLKAVADGNGTRGRKLPLAVARSFIHPLPRRTKRAIDNPQPAQFSPLIMKAPLLLAAVLALVTGCESTAHYNRTKVVMLGPQLPARPLGSVPLFQSKEEVPEPYKVFALMSVEGRAGEEAQFIKAFLYRAADLGADGLILYRVALAAGPEGGGWIAGNGGGIGAGYNTRHEAV